MSPGWTVRPDTCMTKDAISRHEKMATELAELRARTGHLEEQGCCHHSSTFFSGTDNIPWCDSDIVLGFEREVAQAENGSDDEHKSACLLRLSWALVHSKRPEDVQRGIAMLEGSLPRTSDPLQMREKMYLLAVGYYRSGDYSRSRHLVDRCLEIAPDWRQAITLKKSIEDHIKKGKLKKYYGTFLNSICHLGSMEMELVCECFVECYADGVIGIGIAATAVGLVAGGLAAALSRKK
ncbi:hypothetical protein E3N88_29393 [Mikania micrantha]|uniref:Mitochondrial fission 1 protein n=1 Tax=Mikania micrantha TaxID=192012 RepID=A0A5N6MIX3_9ASTR|nr:hypothetical protein E3N88_29393 [Mikania micrantha]